MYSWQFDPAPTLALSPLERLLRVPREHDLLRGVLRRLIVGAEAVLVRALFSLRVEGGEHLPKSSSFIIVANHSSHLDTLALLTALPRNLALRTYPAAARDYFFTSVQRSILSVLSVNALPFDRQGDCTSSIAACRKVLEQPDSALIFFPEGTRSSDGKLHEFKRGIGMLSAARSLPVVPAAICGAYDAWPKGQSLPRPGSITVRFGRPRCFVDFPDSKRSYRTIAHILQQDVRELLDLSDFK